MTHSSILSSAFFSLLCLYFSSLASLAQDISAVTCEEQQNYCESLVPANCLARRSQVSEVSFTKACSIFLSRYDKCLSVFSERCNSISDYSVKTFKLPRKYKWEGGIEPSAEHWEPSQSPTFAADALLPSPSLVSALKSISVQEPTSEIEKHLQRFYLNESCCNSLTFQTALDSEGREFVPWFNSNRMLIRLKNDLDAVDIRDLIRKFDMTVIETLPATGQMTVEVDISKYFSASADDKSENSHLLRGARLAADAFESDPRIENATVDTYLSAQQQTTDEIDGLETAKVETLDGSEAVGWGISDIEADKVWLLSPSLGGAVFGVMDVGFAEHEDIVFLRGLSRRVEKQDHGNIVAGIACATHNNGTGIFGVIPRCFVKAMTPTFFPSDQSGSRFPSFYRQFSQIVRSFVQRVGDDDGVKTYNISLGYNWVSNFGVNPDDPEYDDYREFLSSQGEHVLPMLALAAQKGAVIFSAAGNDSSGLDKPIEARFASPFNWATLEARSPKYKMGMVGVIVEAHNSNGIRAPFSNVGGDISCPGVNILSASAGAYDSYRRSSGTSMAAPHCSAAHTLLSLVRPHYPSETLVYCMLASSKQSTSGAPRLKLLESLAACPEGANAAKILILIKRGIDGWLEYERITPQNARP